MLQWLIDKLTSSGINRSRNEVTRYFTEVVSPIVGHLELSVVDDSNTEIFTLDDDNVVLTQGKYEIMKLLRDNAGRETNGVVRSISRLVVGDGGCPSNDLFTPKTLDKSRVSLFNPVHITDITSSSHPSSDSLEIITSINSNNLSVSDFNAANGGEYLNESSLVSSIPGVFSSGKPGSPGVDDPSEVSVTHKTHKSFPFTPGLSITATWKWTLYIVL